MKKRPDNRHDTGAFLYQPAGSDTHLTRFPLRNMLHHGWPGWLEVDGHKC